jgi:hypothetical protein
MSTSGIDFTRPNVARVYDHMLGGSASYQADRELADALDQICRGVREIALSGREFLARAVTWAATQGIAQFIDLGSGIPAAAEYGRAHNFRNFRLDADAHAIARAVNPAATVAYVDHDPVVGFEAPFLLEPAGPAIAAVTADLRDPETVLEDKGLREVIDPAEPYCLVLGLLPARQARQVVAGYADLIAPGCCVVISTGRFDEAGLGRQVQAAYTPARLHNHAQGTVASFFAGLELVRPGVKPAAGLRPGWGDAPGAPGRVRARRDRPQGLSDPAGLTTETPRLLRRHARPGHEVVTRRRQVRTSRAPPARSSRLL